MGKKLSPEQNDLYKRVDEVLHYLWDPIGVSGVPEARDEYHSYLPVVFSMLIRDCPKNEISEYLVNIEVDSMGLPKNKINADSIADLLIQWKAKIFE
ncbi:MAG: hypothetical protein HKN83_04130 [Gammaproteobacteria bacterium]|nr:hypothetical protein [Gammaproteobacteria bacterium]